MLLFKNTYFILLVACIFTLFSCNKKEFLDEKPSTDILIPSTLKDFQALLDNEPVMSETPILGELSADNYYLTDSYWQNNLSATEHNGYIWAKEIYNGEGNIDDWNKPYKQVFYCNVVLEGLTKISVTSDNEQQWNAIKGSALFMRAFAFYNLAQVFAPVYDTATADTALGIPLRLNPAIDDKTTRATVQQTYNLVLTDLDEATHLLPSTVNNIYPNRPCRPAALALLARIYLSMRIYDKASLYANSCLDLYNTLIDYNRVTNGNFPFEWSNDETMYQSKINVVSSVLQGLAIPSCIIDSSLYQSYSNNDLRKSLFFKTSNISNGLPYLKGSYTGTVFLFSGLATDEVYLIRAECSARANNFNEALNDLNKLLRFRIVDTSFVPYTTSTVPDVLKLVLGERRKELPFRGLRWSDLRRLNKEQPGITLQRNIGGRIYELKPDDKNYVLPIPPDVINLTDIKQNERH